MSGEGRCTKGAGEWICRWLNGLEERASAVSVGTIAATGPSDAMPKAFAADWL